MGCVRVRLCRLVVPRRHGERSSGASAAAGSGGAHAANEYFIIEGAGNTYGMAGMEKSLATAIYEYAGENEEE